MAARPAERPVIGVTAYEEEASWGHWHTQACLVPSGYLRSLADCGGEPCHAAGPRRARVHARHRSFGASTASC